MNRIRGTVQTIERTDVVNFIHVACGGMKMSLIKAVLPEWLDVGDDVDCTFQEASVCISKECTGKVSIENRVPGTLKSVRKNTSLCELTFDCEAGKVVSLITSHTFDDLGLKEGCRATMLIRGVDIQLEPVIQTFTRIKDAN